MSHLNTDSESYPIIADGIRSHADDEGSRTRWVLLTIETLAEFMGVAPAEIAAAWADRFEGDAWGECFEGDACWGDVWEAAVELTGWCGYRGAPGQWFWSSPAVRVTRSRVLVTQYGGLDI